MKFFFLFIILCSVSTLAKGKRLFISDYQNPNEALTYQNEHDQKKVLSTTRLRSLLVTLPELQREFNSHTGLDLVYIIEALHPKDAVYVSDINALLAIHQLKSLQNNLVTLTQPSRPCDDDNQNPSTIEKNSLGLGGRTIYCRDYCDGDAPRTRGTISLGVSFGGSEGSGSISPGGTLNDNFQSVGEFLRSQGVNYRDTFYDDYFSPQRRGTLSSNELEGLTGKRRAATTEDKKKFDWLFRMTPDRLSNELGKEIGDELKNLLKRELTTLRLLGLQVPEGRLILPPSDNALREKLYQNMQRLQKAIGFLKSGLKGGANALKDNWDALVSIIDNPEQLKQAYDYVAEVGFEKIAEDIANGLEEKWDEFLDADGNRKSEMIGATVVEVGLIFLPVGEAKIGIEAVKTALKGSKVTERATDIAKIASLFGRKVSPTTVMNTAKKFTEKFGIKSSNFLKEIAKNETGAIGNLNKVSDLVKKTSDDVAEWIGRDARLIKKDSGDIIVLSKDGNKRFRVDINRTNPHQNPHAHIEELIDGKWIKSGPVYPRDVPHN